MKWFRVYSEIKDDPKMLELDDHQFRLWMSLLAMASESEQRGVIQGYRTRGFAAALRTDEDRLSEAINLFDELDMVAYDEISREITIINWDDRQYDKPSDTPEATRDRKRRQRERARDNQLQESEVTPESQSSHADVTPCHATEKKRVDTETEIATSAAQGARDVVPLMTNTERQVVDILLELPEISHIPIPDLLEHYRSFPSIKRLSADDQLYEAMGFRDLWRERFDADAKRRGKPWQGWKNGMNHFYRRSKPTVAANGRASPRRTKGPDYSGFDEFNRDMDALERRHAT